MARHVKLGRRSLRGRIPATILSFCLFFEMSVQSVFIVKKNKIIIHSVVKVKKLWYYSREIKNTFPKFKGCTLSQSTPKVPFKLHLFDSNYMLMYEPKSSGIEEQTPRKLEIVYNIYCLFRNSQHYNTVASFSPSEICVLQSPDKYTIIRRS